MNLQLLSPLHQVRVPDRLETSLLPPDFQSDASLVPPSALSLAFNRQGTYLAAGYADGRLLIWDFFTRSCEGGTVPGLTIPEAHEGSVTSVSWSRSSTYLLTSG